MSETYQFTEGNVPKLLLKFYFPMLFSNLLQQLYTIADSAIVDKGLGDDAFAAIGATSSLNLLIIGFAMGLTNGFSVLIAQCFGAGKQTALRKSVALSVSLSAVITILLTIFSLFGLKPMLLFMNTPEQILSDSLLYGLIVFGCLTVTFAYHLCACILRALGDSKTPFIAIVVSSVTNIILDLILIFLVETGVEGAAIATVLSQAVSVSICLLKIRRIPLLHLTREDFFYDASVCAELIKNGIPMACMNSVTAVGGMVVQSYINALGLVCASAYSACSRLLNFFMLPSVTAGFSVSAFTSQNFGAHKTDRIREGISVCISIALVSYLLLGTIMVLFPEAVAGLVLNGNTAIRLAADYLRICGMMLFSLNLLFVFRSCVQGMGHPVIPMCSGILEMALRIPMIMVFLHRIGFIAAAYAEAVAWVGALALNLLAYWIYIRKIQ